MGDAGLKRTQGIIPLRLAFKKSSPTLSTFSASQILPETFPKLDLPSAHIKLSADPPHLDPTTMSGRISQGAPSRSASPPSVFDPIEENADPDYTEPTARNSGSDEPGAYDLKPPPPSVSHTNVEVLSERFFSVDHLNLILRDHALSARFARFLNKHKPQSVPTLVNYIEIQKAITAVEYANALVDGLPPATGHPPYIAASLDERFEARCRRTVEELVSEALPGYITHRLVQLATETLVKEITGQNTPIMREMIPSLAEVYCITDPSLPDNPIVYASQEFYNVSQYGREYVIGRNCRFLQGPKTSTASVKRLIQALAAGQEITETILNYRRDGTPFMNLLMIAPLYDNKGTVRYFLGCQIDVSPLVEGGRGLESFEQLLAQDRADSRFGGRPDRNPDHMLGELGQMLNEHEVEIVRKRARSYSQSSERGTPTRSLQGNPRRILGMDDAGSDRGLWPHPSLGPSGRLPGVYQNYLLVRPYPSLRITFTSPALRIPGLLQTKFLDRIGGPQHVREGILDALAHGTSVTAKVSWLTHPIAGDLAMSRGSMEGKPRWIHCTPMLGSDEKVGVWMVVMVENEEVTGSLHRGSMSEQGIGSPMQGAASRRFTGDKLYTEYLRREGKSSGPDRGGMMSPNSIPSRTSSRQARERRTAEHSFRDF